MLDVPAARALAGELLGVESRRWRHSAAVAEQAGRVATGLVPAEADLLVGAAWLHDIGYAPILDRSAFHPLDGACYLRSLGHEDLARLTAHHSSSDVEARHRGLTAKLAEFPAPPPNLLDALTFCDMTSGPNGERMTVEERLDEILHRYGTHHVVGRSIAEASGALCAAVRRFDHRA